MRQEGLDPDRWLVNPRFDTAVGRVVARLLAEADRLYSQAEAGIALLPKDCQGAIRAASWVYAEIGREVERHELNSVDSRAVVTNRRKLMLLGKALAWPTRIRRVREGDRALEPALAATQFLVDAARRPPLSDDGEQEISADADGRVVWMIDLFERREAERLRRNDALVGQSGDPWKATTGR
jgi:phytoene synthase